MKIESCEVCLEKAFELGVKPIDGQNICKRCARLRKPQKSGYTREVDPYSADNNMDPGAIPDGLPELSVVEECLIARASVQMSVWKHKGNQYHYSGHVYSFMTNTAKIAAKLPLLPHELQILKLVPPSNDPDSNIRREFKKRCIVRRPYIEIWLRYLIAYHPGYSDLIIDEHRLSQLPLDSSVYDELPSQDQQQPVSEENGQNADEMPAEMTGIGGADAPVVEEFIIPDLTNEETERQQLTAALNRGRGEDQDKPVNPKIPTGIPTFSAPSIRGTPISENNPARYIPLLAFPTLFLNRQASFTASRRKTIAEPDYVRHLMRYNNGRFARYPGFRYWAFNHSLREQASKASSFM